MPAKQSDLLNAVRAPASATRCLPGGDATERLCIGYSVQGRPLEVQVFGDRDAPLRALLICGQHGDERAIRGSLRRFLTREAPALTIAHPNIQFAVLADANPDGYAARRRLNAQGIDLNRDHLRLSAPETRAIHRFVAAWRPHWVADLHNYPSRRVALLQQGLRLPWDVCIEFPTHPAARFAQGHPLLAALASSLHQDAEQIGFRFGRYLLRTPDGMMRHGTPALGDARNTIALKFDAFTCLLEARNPSRHDSPSDRRAVRGAAAAVCARFLQWASLHAAAVIGSDGPHPAGELVPLGYRRRIRSDHPLPFVELSTNDLRWMTCSRYRHAVLPRRRRPAPWAYAIPWQERSLIGFLEQHGFGYRLTRPGERFDVEPAHQASGAATTAALPGCALFPCAQTGGRLLMLLLEEDSQSAIHRCLKLTDGATGQPRVLRVAAPSSSS